MTKRLNSGFPSTVRPEYYNESETREALACDPAGDECYSSVHTEASTASGFLGGAVVFTAVNWLLARQGAKHRKRSGKHQASESRNGGGGTAIAVGALLDGIPEALVIGLSMLDGGAVSIVAVAAIFLSNIPEGLSSAAGMITAAGFLAAFALTKLGA